jgi:hypothetical protein
MITNVFLGSEALRRASFFGRGASSTAGRSLHPAHQPPIRMCRRTSSWCRRSSAHGHAPVLGDLGADVPWLWVSRSCAACAHVANAPSEPAVRGPAPSVSGAASRSPACAPWPRPCGRSTTRRPRSRARRGRRSRSRWSSCRGSAPARNRGRPRGERAVSVEAEDAGAPCVMRKERGRGRR